MQKCYKKSYFKRNIIILVCFSLIICILFATVAIKIKPLVYTYAKSYAETLFLNAADRSVVEILSTQNIAYNDIVYLSKNSENNITGLEIGIEKINLLKSMISREISKDISSKENYDLFIPLGTLTGNEYLIGLGPKIKFPMQATATAVVDFKSNFYSAGINQVLHQILITIKVNGNILMTGYTNSFSVETSTIAAQTVIVGITPDAYTNVIEGGGSSVVGDIFDYGAQTDSNGE